MSEFLLQDLDRRLSRWFASRLDAKYQVRRACALIQRSKEISMSSRFYVPRAVVTMLQQTPRPTNPNVCVKVEYKGFEISLALDSSHGSGDLKRGDFRIYGLDAVDFTERVMADLKEEGAVLYGDLETLIKIKGWVDGYHNSTPQQEV